MADLDILLSSAQGGQLIANLAERFGLSEEQMRQAVGALAPALSAGLENAVEKPEGLGKVVERLCASNECCAHDHADAAHAPDAVDRGQAAVLSLFGSEDNTDKIVRAAAQQTGISANILAQLLPILASVLFSGLNKSMGDGGMGGLLGKVLEQLLRGGANTGGGLGGGLGDILGQVIAGGQQGQRGGAGGGLGDILGQVIAGGQASPRGGQAQAPGGGLGEIFGKVLGELARGGGMPGGAGRAPSGGGGFGGGQDPRSRGGDPLETADASAGGLDQASVQQAIDKIKQSLQINRNSGGASASGGAQSGQTDLEKVLGQIFGQRG